MTHTAHIDTFYNRIIKTPGKFHGLRYAVQVAYEISLAGFQSDDFGCCEGCCETWNGYFCRVYIGDGEGDELRRVCFKQDELGFVYEITNDVYEYMKAEWEKYLDTIWITE